MRKLFDKARWKAEIAPARRFLPSRKTALALTMIFLMTCIVTHPNIRNDGIDDLDSAHHIMDGYFFRDLLIDHPSHALNVYLLNYYKQYPALGFVFWPPLIPIIFGLFCLVGGPHVLVIRLCMFGFALLFAVAFYTLLRRQYTTYLSLAGVFALMSAPGMVWSFNEIMLELPTLAVMCVAALAYFRLVDRIGTPGTYQRAFCCALACAAVVYSKQPAWFLYCALVLHFLVCHRSYLRRREIWFTVATTAILCLPLVIFTAKFGRANLGQSVGSSTNQIMQGYRSLQRWSLAAWAYYPRLAPSLLNPVLCLISLAGLGAIFRRFVVFKENSLWIGWLCFGYVTFSYYDNRLPRHATFWWPAWIAIALAALKFAMDVMPAGVRLLVPLVILLPIPSEIKTAWKASYTDYPSVQQPIAQLFNSGGLGNVLVFGRDQQVLTVIIREHDIGRAVHIIRGERLLTGNHDLQSVCQNYRISTILVEQSEDRSSTRFINSADFRWIKQISQATLFWKAQSIQLIAYHYVGPMNPTMADVTLSSKFID